MWERLLVTMLDRFIRVGTFNLTLPSGQVRVFGSGEKPRLSAELKTESAVRAIVKNPELGIGEAYMDEAFVITEGTLHDFFALAIANRRSNVSGWWKFVEEMRNGLRKVKQISTRARSARDVGHHYELSPEFYDLFLSPDRMYSCAYFAHDNTTLEAAQDAKIEHIARKLLLKPGMRVLDIGCGWGHAACTIAERYGVHVTGVALAKNQIEAAKATAAKRNLTGLTEFRYQDYRDVPETFDRVYSIGMAEHVGLPQFPTYFGKIHDVLGPDGIALIHFIGRQGRPLETSPWVRKYIFPGGYCPSLSEVAPVIERSGLVTCDLEVLRDQYERTLNHWWQRFEANRDKVEAMYDARFLRMWRYYLNAAEMGFRGGDLTVFQFQLARNALAVPRTRAYLYDAAALPQSEAAE